MKLAMLAIPTVPRERAGWFMPLFFDAAAVFGELIV